MSIGLCELDSVFVDVVLGVVAGTSSKSAHRCLPPVTVAGAPVDIPPTTSARGDRSVISVVSVAVGIPSKMLIRDGRSVAAVEGGALDTFIMTSVSGD